MKRFLCCGIWMLLSIVCNTQSIHYPARIEAMGAGDGSPRFTDAFSFTGNPALLASQARICAGLYGGRKFLLKELSLLSAVCSFPLAGGGMGLQLLYAGFADFNESYMSISYGRKLGKSVELGILFNYGIFHIAGYGNKGGLTAGAGIMIHPAEKISLGIFVFNPAGGGIGKNTGEKIASLYKTSIRFEASPEVHAGMELIKEEERPFGVKASLQYQFASQFFAGLGMVSAPAAPFGWAGWARKNLRLDIHVSYHPQLGFTPALVCFFGSPFPVEK